MSWLSSLLKMFYAPTRAMAEVRDAAPLGPALAIAFVAQWLFYSYVLWPYMLAGRSAAALGAAGFASIAFKAGVSLLFTLIIFVPVVIFVANVMERRASFGLTLQQEYAPVASTLLYARVVSVVAAFPLMALFRVTGGETEVFGQSLRMAEEWRRQMPEMEAITPAQLAESYAFMLMLPVFTIWLVFAVRELFRFSWPRTFVAVLASALITLPLMTILWPLFERVFSSIFFLLLLFFLMRGYIGEVMRGQRARASFKQNLEAATLNPADASAHYNLGLLHLQRRELAEARARFERAIEIDPEETDSHYQLGRIARAQSRWADAIQHYSEALRRDQTHAQYEVWREAGATYISAGQYSDALDALERFLEHRRNDPEGLYLMGRAHAGLGRRREAVEWLQACIEAVRTSPAYKYRSEKRWASEAQQFLRSLA